MSCHSSRTAVVGLVLAVLLTGPFLRADLGVNDHAGPPVVHENYVSIRTPNGKLYAYVVLLFNENPHFVNIIQEQSIPMDLMQKEGFHVSEYRNYLRTLKDQAMFKLAESLLDVYLHPQKPDEKYLGSLQDVLEKRNIILRFSKDRTTGNERVVLDYCIYGTKKPLSIAHPLITVTERIYNIIPFIYYDEFSTSNSTFYFDMIYINPEEVQNDYIIAKKVLSGDNVDSMFFVGARVSDDIKYCLMRSFGNARSIKGEIWKLFEIHEVTHKILNNHYNYYDQVMGEELALSSTIYSNVFLGLSVLYSYLDYNTTNPHRIAAMNYIKFVAAEINKKDLMENPSLLKMVPASDLQKLSKMHFSAVLKNLK
jgi:hypothetical protein